MLIAASASAEGFVLSMTPDGRLTASAPQDTFAQTYENASRTDTEALVLFGARASEPREAISPEHTHPAPSAAILSAIDEVALRYAAHASLRQAGLSVTDWQALFQANVEVESAYQVSALSSAGAIGLGQLMPETARQLGVNPHDWRANLDGSARYLLMMLARFGTPELALAAYNAGPDAVERQGGIPPYTETRNHVRRVMDVVARLTGAL